MGILNQISEKMQKPKSGPSILDDISKKMNESGDVTDHDLDTMVGLRKLFKLKPDEKIKGIPTDKIKLYVDSMGTAVVEKLKRYAKIVAKHDKPEYERISKILNTK